ncbi:L-serine ammonia-lyase, iron-sulfur-dependent, subunit alpha [Clostridium sp.]|jgi:L-serine dehydratase|uniref:L-serine ammonia-lyase, iron-sulfur-dependent, subunit alpha n=1 Tax=Clostridium sp. TaxID=1506 RepID=UPI00258EC5E7|nr:L-serine ammonia-lyase, iron-sulfur-dependent, subunit alpha [Clostridium sp.]MDF2503107.1 L-serine dehydratase, iron-sulfur-dependent, alpha subunit [Clostridium sp.]
MFVNTGKELIDICSSKNIPIWKYTLLEEIEKSGETEKIILNRLKRSLNVMREAAEYGLTHEVSSVSGLIGKDAVKVYKYAKNNDTICGNFLVMAMARALSCSEVNAAMGKIVAAPTAGSCGILPAVIITTGQKYNKSEEELVRALLTASGIGIIIAKNATLAGAEGGCQAECGSASAMASGAIVEMLGGSPKEALDASAIVIKNILGLVCDPIAGLVEVPCAKRNIGGTVSALSTADLVLSGVESKIPFDDCVDAMHKIGKQMPCELRETAMGGLAITKTGMKLKAMIQSKNEM